MRSDAAEDPIELFSSCPPSSGVPRERYIERVVTMQPIYVHPYTAAKMGTPIAHLHGGRVYLYAIPRRPCPDPAATGCPRFLGSGIGTGGCGARPWTPCR
jgi:hypothetical protein